MQKSDRARFLGKSPFLTISTQNGPKMAQNQPFCPISKFRHYFWLQFVPKRASYGNKSYSIIRFLRKTQFLAFFAKNALVQSDRSILKSRYLVNHLSDLSDFCGMFFLELLENEQKSFLGSNFF